MPYGICLLSVVPCRSAPSDTAEMVSQLLFGEHYEVLEEGGGWLKIHNHFDGYESWISLNQHQKINDSSYRTLCKQSPFFSMEPVQVVHNKINQRNFPVLIGSVLPFFNKGLMSFESWIFGFEGQTSNLRQKKGAGELIASAFLFLDAPYQWGGRSLFGVDCSGFVQTVFKINGHQLPRDAWQQVLHGTALDFADEAEAGDLAFFDNEEGKIVHVGIVIGNSRIIHASGFVRIDAFDHYGIFNADLGKYSHSLRVIKRMF